MSNIYCIGHCDTGDDGAVAVGAGHIHFWTSSMAVAGSSDMLHKLRWVASEGQFSCIHMNLGSHRPSCSRKKRGACFCPLSSILRRISRWASSTADFASVAASISFKSIAYVSLDHNLNEGSWACHLKPTPDWSSLPPWLIRLLFIFV